MAFSDLPIDLQNIYLTNIELGIKIALFVFIILFCYVQIIRLKEKNKNNKTPYFMVAYIRGWLGIMSYIFLFLSPLLGVFIFYPGFSIENFQIGLMIFYTVAFFVVTGVLLINFFFLLRKYIIFTSWL